MEELSATALRDIVRMFCGKQLGAGSAREVYVLASDPTRVIKIENGAGSFQNILEWETWRQLAHSGMQKFLAPCYEISPCGMALIQARVEPLPSANSHPLLKKLQLPEFLTDFKRSNYGVLRGRVVACDYGTNLAVNHGACRAGMRRPRWRTDAT